MMALTAKTPSLYKPKSKIRLRLGLTPPHPQPQPKAAASVTIAAPAAKPPVKEEPKSAESTRSFNHPTSTQTSPDDHSKSLNTSQITHSSRSRPDSRDAFALEISPSTQSTHSPHRANFDTISYATQSPASLALTKINNPSYPSVSTNDVDPYPTPSPSSSPSRDTSVVSTANESSTAHQPGIQPEDPTLTHPHVAEAAAASDHIFHLTDEQLSDRFNFVKEIGYGNWGSVWLCRPKHPKGKDEGPMSTLGRSAAAGGGSKSAGKVAIKLVHRSKSPTTSARVRALWGEMKIIRALRYEPHPSIIQFEAFVITPSYALVIMPFLADLIPVCLPPERATPYFRQLCSAVGYLHERGITHNDIKPANVLLSYNDIPVLVDFGFAQKWDVGERGSFLSSISWGTPEYLDPQRAMGMPHDERASDVWSLGITMFEVLVGRTPFEEEEELDEEFHSPDDLVVYYERSRRGEWIGEWSFIPKNLQHLLRAMICPDPAYRMTAMQAYHHPSLQPQAASVIVTPHFVRAAASCEFSEPVPGVDKEKDKKKRKAKKREAGHGREAQPRAATPALGESIKQHTSAPPPKKGDKDKAELESPAKKVVVKKSREALDVSPDKDKEQDPTPTRKSNPAGSLRIKELSYQKEQSGGLRSSDSQDNDISRQSSLSKTVPTQTSRDSSSTVTAKPVTQPKLTHHDSRRTLKTRDSNLSMATTSTVALTKEEAVLKAMRRLEGKKKESESVKRDVLGSISRPAPSPPRPRSLDSQIEVDVKKKEDHRRSLGLEKRLMDVLEESPVNGPTQVKVEATIELTRVNFVEAQSPSRADNSQTTSPLKPSTPTQGMSSRKPTPFPGCTPTKPSPLRDSATSKRQVSMASPPRPRLATRPTEVVADGGRFPAGTTSSTETLPFPVLPMPVDDGRQSPLSELRERILSDDLGSEKHQTRVRQLSGDLIASRMPNSASEDATPPQSTVAVPASNGTDASALGGRLDQLALWVKDVEKMVEDARKALAEGRESPLSLPVLNMQIPPAPLTTALPTSPASTSSKKDAGAEHRFGVTPDKPDALPAHLRTCSTQVEPATPPKWMSYEEAEERVKQANEWDEKGGMKRTSKKERPTVSHVLKLFGNDKLDKAGLRAHTPEPMASVPLKSLSLAHTLRGAPSTPALRSTTSRQSSKPLTRKSESNLRNFNTMPTNLTFAEALRPISPTELSPRRAVYEDLLQSEPGVVRQGDGWSSWSSGPSRGIKQPSSMVSLRERALAFLRDDKDKVEAGGTMRERNILDLAQEVEKHGSRYGEPGPGRRPATPGANSVMGLKRDAKKGIFGRFRGKFGKKEKDEVVAAAA